MILVDLNQICMANIMQEVNANKNENLSPDYVRHLILNSIRSINVKFREEYSRLVLVNDSTQYWRKLVFPYYKGNRKQKQNQSIYDFNVIFGLLNSIKQEIREHFPYPFLQVPHAEADDIIAVLSKNYYKNEKILIISTDRDFLQLQRYSNITQFSITTNSYLKEENPRSFLIEKILTGDSGDGVPNYLSDDDTLVNENKRQRRVYRKNIEKFITLDDHTLIFKQLNEEEQRRYMRNRMLIDFDFIPYDLQNNIISEFESYTTDNDLSTIYKYLVNHKMKSLLINIGDFLDQI